MPWYGASQTTGLFVVFFVLFFPGSILAFGGRLIWFRSHHPNARASGRIAWIGLLAALSNLLFFVLFGAFFYITDTQALFKGVPLALRATLILPVVSVVLIVVPTTLVLRALLRKSINAAAGIYPALFIISSVAFFWWLNYWNLLGFTW